MSIHLTEAAATHIQRLMGTRGKGIGLRFGVKSSGCSGLAYVVEFADQVSSDEQVFEDKGIKVVVSKKNLAYLDGTEMDFGKDGLNEGFQFNNPNVKNECGCGESFGI